MRSTSLVLTILAGISATWGVSAGEMSKDIFDGKSMTGWKLKGDNKDKSKWKIGTAVVNDNNANKLVVNEQPGQLVNEVGSGVDIFTEEKFGDVKVTVEFMIPKESNSGIYLMGEYEVQVFDSYGKDKLQPVDLGSIYSAKVPLVNAAKKYGEWQKFEIEFQAPKFDGDKKVANAKFVKVTLNGQVIHENVEVKGPTPGGLTGKEAAKGPLMFQGDHGPVAFRSVRIAPLK